MESARVRRPKKLPPMCSMTNCGLYCSIVLQYFLDVDGPLYFYQSLDNPVTWASLFGPIFGVDAGCGAVGSYLDRMPGVPNPIINSYLVSSDEKQKDTVLIRSYIVSRRALGWWWGQGASISWGLGKRLVVGMAPQGIGA